MSKESRMTAGVLSVPLLVPLRHVDEAVQKREEEETGFVIHKAGLNQDITTEGKEGYRDDQERAAYRGFRQRSGSGA